MVDKQECAPECEYSALTASAQDLSGNCQPGQFNDRVSRMSSKFIILSSRWSSSYLDELPSLL